MNRLTSFCGVGPDLAWGRNPESSTWMNAVGRHFKCATIAEPYTFLKTARAKAACEL